MSQGAGPAERTRRYLVPSGSRPKLSGIMAGYPVHRRTSAPVLMQEAARRVRDSDTLSGTSGKQERRRARSRRCATGIPARSRPRPMSFSSPCRCPAVVFSRARLRSPVGNPGQLREAASARVCRAASSVVDKQPEHVGPPKMFTLSLTGRPQVEAGVHSVRPLLLDEPRGVARTQKSQCHGGKPVRVNKLPIFTARLGGGADRAVRWLGYRAGQGSWHRTLERRRERVWGW